MANTTSWNEILPAGQPDFNNLLAVLNKEVPARPTLFEFFLNERLYEKIRPGASAILREKGNDAEDKADGVAFSTSALAQTLKMQAYQRAGYDYVSVLVPGVKFPSERGYDTRTVSINEGGLIHDWASYEAYPWPDPEKAGYSVLDAIAPELPPDMKIVVYGPGGVLENVIELIGYQTLCYWLVDEPKLVQEIFDQVGSRLLRYYELASKHPAVGACISNDDWGFKTQTMLSTRQMRQYVFPWHKQIVSAIHAAGKPAILHSCGHFERILDDLADMDYDGRHSYEDVILPVEQAYERYHDKFAILGGIDIDFICRASPEQVYERARKLLQQTATHGGYALGTGNSVPDYVPDENYFAMIRAVLELR
jgi:uroporphyrinogen decarboxylase